jgi:hypothetical protein
MAIKPINKMSNIEPVQTKYTARTAEDFKQQNIANNFQIYGNSPMKPTPIQFTPVQKQPSVE